MANEILEAVTIRLEFETGMDQKGMPIVKRKSFSNVKTDAASDDILAATQAIAGLQMHPLSKVVQMGTTVYPINFLRKERGEENGKNTGIIVSN